MRSAIFIALGFLFLFFGCLQAKSYFDPTKDLRDLIPVGPSGQEKELRPISPVYSVDPLALNIDDSLLNLTETYETHGYPLIFPTGVLMSRLFKKDENSDLSLSLIKTNMVYGSQEHVRGCLHTASYEMAVVFEKNGTKDVMPINTKGCGSRGWPWAGRAAIEEAAITAIQCCE